MRKTKKRTNPFVGILVVVSIICIVICFSFMLFNGDETEPEVSSNELSETVSSEIVSSETSSEASSEVSSETSSEVSSTAESTEVKITYIDGILLVNKKHPIPKDYDPGMDKEAMAAFEEMKAAAKEEGIPLTIVSAYRSYSYQQTLYNNKVSAVGEAEANKSVAKPGESEHQTGLALDINDLEQDFAGTTAGQWLAANAHKYGYILRYPKGKEHITGYIYEPWHFRYLGKENAQKVYDSGLCLEEYLNVEG